MYLYLTLTLTLTLNLNLTLTLRRVVRGLGRAFLYLSIHLSHGAHAPRTAASATSPRHPARGSRLPAARLKRSKAQAAQAFRRQAKTEVKYRTIYDRSGDPRRDIRQSRYRKVGELDLETER